MPLIICQVAGFVARLKKRANSSMRYKVTKCGDGGVVTMLDTEEKVSNRVHHPCDVQSTMLNLSRLRTANNAARTLIRILSVNPERSELKAVLSVLIPVCSNLFSEP
jgi:hypothetical protein